MKQPLSPQNKFPTKKKNKQKQKQSSYEHSIYTSRIGATSDHIINHQHQLELPPACCQKSDAISEPVSLSSQVCLVL